jgi:hypothetical protein
MTPHIVRISSYDQRTSTQVQQGKRQLLPICQEVQNALDQVRACPVEDNALLDGQEVAERRWCDPFEDFDSDTGWDVNVLLRLRR